MEVAPEGARSPSDEALRADDRAGDATGGVPGDACATDLGGIGQDLGAPGGTRQEQRRVGDQGGSEHGSTLPERR